jgi:hypothetical protein
MDNNGRIEENEMCFLNLVTGVTNRNSMTSVDIIKAIRIEIAIEIKCCKDVKRTEETRMAKDFF